MKYSKNTLCLMNDTNLYKELNNKFEGNDVFDIEKIKNNRNLPNSIYSAKQILKKIPINFDIKKYYINNQLFGLNKYEVINHYIKNNKSPEKKLIKIYKKNLIILKLLYISSLNIMKYLKIINFGEKVLQNGTMQS